MVMLNEVTYSQGKKRLYDIIILDVNMPIKNGYEACELIIKHYMLISESY